MDDETPFGNCPECDCSDVPDWYATDWEVWDWTCPACGAVFHLEREIVYHVERTQKSTKTTDEIEYYFATPEEKQRWDAQKKIADEKSRWASLTAKERLIETGRKQKKTLPQFLRK